MFTSRKQVFQFVIVGLSFSMLSLHETSARIESNEFVFSGGPYVEEAFHYQLYVPDILTKGETYPLILWMHGVGRAGRDNQAQLVHIYSALVTWEEENGEFPGFILWPQAPKAFASWHNQGSGEETGQMQDLFGFTRQLLQTTIEEYPIDKKRISLAGVSAGGTASWEMAIRFPDLFAAVVPMSSTYSNLEQAPRISEIPLWTFHCTGDAAAPIAPVREMVRAIQGAGGRAYLTEIPIVAHDSWSLAFDKYNLLDWLLQQRKGDPSSPAPGYRKWEWWQKFIAIGVPVLLVAALITERRRRQVVITPEESKVDEQVPTLVVDQDDREF